jgi:hypothetical protein
MIALPELNKQIGQLADRCAKLSHDLKRLDTDDDQARQYFGRIASHLGDLATIARSTAPPLIRDALDHRI